jgi:hypothetical protein
MTDFQKIKEMLNKCYANHMDNIKYEDCVKEEFFTIEKGDNCFIINLKSADCGNIYLTFDKRTGELIEWA